MRSQIYVQAALFPGKELPVPIDWVGRPRAGQTQMLWKRGNSLVIEPHSPARSLYSRYIRLVPISARCRLNSFKNAPPLRWAGIDQSLRTGRSADQISVGGKILRTRLDRTWGSPSLLYNGYRLPFPWVKRPGRGVNHPLPSSAEVKERVELYLYSPS